MAAAMKLNSLVRRASSSIIPRRQSTNGSSAIFPLNSIVGGRQFLRFSTAVVDDDIASLLEPGDSTTTVPDISSFKVQEATCTPRYYDLSLMSESDKETILVHVGEPYKYEHKKPVGEVEVCISRGEQQIEFELRAKPDEFEVVAATMWNKNGDHLENFEEYLRSKGVTVDLINMLYDRMGINTKNNALANP